jgi:hypothetical protein
MMPWGGIRGKKMFQPVLVISGSSTSFPKFESYQAA